MQCRWCGYESADINDFDEDFKNHMGFWCLRCEGFTYYNQDDDTQKRTIFLESAGAEIKNVRNGKKIDKRISPLRYPGGKSKWIHVLTEQIDMEKNMFVEPFCGGASVSLALLSAGIVQDIVINDADFGIYGLFQTIMESPEYLIERLKSRVPDRKDYFSFRENILSGYQNMTKEEAGYEYLIVNRLAYSGICRANPKGNLLERYDANKLIKKIEKNHSLRNHITVLNEDALDIIERFYWDSDVTMFIDPPYVEKGRQLYSLYYEERQHENLASLINSLVSEYPGCADVIMTYDECDYIKKLYPTMEQKELKRRYSIAN